MIELIKEIRLALNEDNLRVALGMALTLPDICGQIEYPKENGVRNRYVKWCENHLTKEGNYSFGAINDSNEKRSMDPEIFYKLRCAYLHSGNLELNQREIDSFPKFKLHVTNSKDRGIYVDKIYDKNMIEDQEVISLDIRRLTSILCDEAVKYYNQCESKCEFNTKHIEIVDNEQMFEYIQNLKQEFNNMQDDKKDMSDENELSKLAKEILQEIRLGNSVACYKSFAGTSDEDRFIMALIELIQGGFIDKNIIEN